MKIFRVQQALSKDDEFPVSPDRVSDIYLEV